MIIPGIELAIIIGIVVVGLLFYNVISKKSLMFQNNVFMEMIREKDYEFLLLAKYGDKIDPVKEFDKRLQFAGLGGLLIAALFVINFSLMNFMLIIVSVYLLYKMPYIQLKNFYRKYMSQIDQMLPYYLKTLEILCQNYTVSVAIAKSIDDAPSVFKPGLRVMIEQIDAGDSSIEPYMQFAKRYPVKDSMRMMRLLYRLSLGRQENKYQQLILFSKSVSSLQNKAREDKYKKRLDGMEKRTFIMLVATGGGAMALLLLSMLILFQL